MQEEEISYVIFYTLSYLSGALSVWNGDEYTFVAYTSDNEVRIREAIKKAPVKPTLVRESRKQIRKTTHRIRSQAKYADLPIRTLQAKPPTQSQTGECPTCEGKGTRFIKTCTIAGHFRFWDEQCRPCSGSGTVYLPPNHFTN